MEKTYTGIDIGDHAIKIAVSNGVSIKKIAIEPLPDGMVADSRIVSFDAMADFIRAVARKHRGLEKNVSFVVPAGSCITRHLHVPMMSEKELALNLPFEFRDYIIQGKDKYVYDYTVLSIESDESGKADGMDLLAVASPKEAIFDFTEMFKRAGFRLKKALPPIAALQNLIAQSSHREQNCCVIDFAHLATQLHFFARGTYDVSRTIEIGGIDINRALASQFGLDEHLAGEYKHTDFNSANDTETARQVYDSIAVEAARALNFYSFNNPEITMEVVYCCGGGAKGLALMDAVASQIGSPLASIVEIMPPYGGDSDERMLCPLAVGATIW